MAKYTRPPYGQNGIQVKEVPSAFNPTNILRFPVPEYPITPLENFRLAAARKTPVWFPNSLLDYQTLYSKDCLEGLTAPPWGATEAVVYKDEFGCQWKYVVSAGGAMLDPDGEIVLEDITQWEKTVKFPEIRLTESDFMETRYDPTKVLHVNLFQGLTERLVALTGGYAEAMLAMAEEPEACSDFFNAFADWEIQAIDKICEKYPVNMFTYHDDWGTERDTFFSERMMEEMVFEPTKRIVQHAKSKNAAFELHSCGCIGRFLKYMIAMGVDFLQLQGRANNLIEMKQNFGDKIGFFIMIDKLFRPNQTQEELLSAIRTAVDTFGKSGGAYTSVFGSNPEDLWAMVFELYAYSREFYDKERGE